MNMVNWGSLGGWKNLDVNPKLLIPCAGEPAALLSLGGWDRIQQYRGELRGLLIIIWGFAVSLVVIISILTGWKSEASALYKAKPCLGKFVNHRKKSSQALVSFPCRRFWPHPGHTYPWKPARWCGWCCRTTVWGIFLVPPPFVTLDQASMRFLLRKRVWVPIPCRAVVGSVWWKVFGSTPSTGIGGGLCLPKP